MTIAHAIDPTHVVVATLGSAGDMYPFLGLATALRSRGHRVTFLGPAVHEHLVRQAEFEFHALGTRERHLAAIEDPDLWHPRKGFSVVWRAVSDTPEQLRAFVDTLPATQPCVLLAHPLVLPAAALARAKRRDLRIVGAWLAPSNLRTCHDPLTFGPLQVPRWVPSSWRAWLWRRIDARLVDPVVLPDLEARRRALGLPPIDHFADHIYAVPDLSITLWPSWFAPTQPDWPSPLHAGDFQLHEPDPQRPMSPALERFLEAGDAPVVVTLGTANRHARDVFAAASMAVQRLGVRAVFLTSHREQVPDRLPDAVLWQDYVPLRTLLARASAIVHRGGIGTTAEALRAGVPQLVLPLAHDQFDNAARVRALGAGRVLLSPRRQVRGLGRALRDLLESISVRAGCADVAARFTTTNDAIDAMCRAIESAGAEAR